MSRNLGALTLLDPFGPAGPVMGVLYLYLYLLIITIYQKSMIYNIAIHSF
jgi:hypothetical protein